MNSAADRSQAAQTSGPDTLDKTVAFLAKRYGIDKAGLLAPDESHPPCSLTVPAALAEHLETSSDCLISRRS